MHNTTRMHTTSRRLVLVLASIHTVRAYQLCMHMYCTSFSHRVRARILYIYNILYQYAYYSSTWCTRVHVDVYPQTAVCMHMHTLASTTQCRVICIMYAYVYAQSMVSVLRVVRLQSIHTRVHCTVCIPTSCVSIRTTRVIHVRVSRTTTTARSTRVGVLLEQSISTSYYSSSMHIVQPHSQQICCEYVRVLLKRQCLKNIRNLG